MLSVLQAVHFGVFSSHFFFLIRQVQQPCLLRVPVDMLFGIVSRAWDRRLRDLGVNLTCKNHFRAFDLTKGSNVANASQRAENN